MESSFPLKERSVLPLIPPLKREAATTMKTMTSLSNTNDKENQHQQHSISGNSSTAADKTAKTASTTKNRLQTSERTSLSRPLAAPFRSLATSATMPLHPSQSGKPTVTAKSGESPTTFQSRRRGILRYGETMETLFRIGGVSGTTVCDDPTTTTSPNVEREYQRACQTLLDEQQETAAAWRRMLELAVQRTPVHMSGTDLIRLHRRATARLNAPPKLEQQQEEDDTILSIWLLYAAAQASYGSVNDARTMYKHIQRLFSNKARVYIAWAALEQAEKEEDGDADVALGILELGKQHHAQPASDLEEACRTFLTKSKTSAALDREEDTVVHTNTASTTGRTGANNASEAKKKSPKCQRSESQPTLHLNPPKRIKMTPPEKRIADSSITVSKKEQSPVTTKSSESKSNPASTSIQFQLAPLPRRQSPLLSASESMTEKQTLSPLVLHHHSSPSGVSLTSQHPQLQASGVLRSTTSSTAASSPKPIDDVSKEGTSMDPAAVTRTHQLETTSLSATSPNLSSSNRDLSNETKSATQTPQASKREQQLQIKSVRVVSSALHRRPPLSAKTPLRRLSSRNSNGLSLGKPERVDPHQLQPVQDGDDTEEQEETTMDTTTFLNDVSSSIEHPTASNNNHSSKPKLTKMDLEYMWAWDPLQKSYQRDQQKQLQEEENESRKNNEKSTSSGTCKPSDETIRNANAEERAEVQQPVQLDSSIKSSLSSKEIHSTSKYNPAFLPLVNESNMLRVNKVPYAKLGVIGRGGSCKVYRALSTECNVVAIKKVKLAGMEKKSVEGYSNEIALLKRLRGNPSIIQMFDSQVDLHRKAIFLVMEVGEVDLNHVLQQQTLKGGPQLDMNFIRLTWQQMLTAVHSIHEARIIHGDLKPANFLFVRGTLKLIDFGIAKAMQSDDTTNIYRESQIGTLNYMSPEAILDTGKGGGDKPRMKCGRASDIWSLGCILYQMVYGKTPFAELHMIPKLQAIVNPLHAIAYPSLTGVDEQAVDVIRLCLQREPEKRPPIVGTGGLLNEHKFLCL